MLERASLILIALALHACVTPEAPWTIIYGSQGSPATTQSLRRASSSRGTSARA